MRRRTALLPILLAGLVLAGCSSAAPAVDPGAGSAESQTGTDADGAATGTAEPDASALVSDGMALPECEGILFESGAVVPGQQLGDCMAAAMIAAGSGEHRVESSDGSVSLVQFEWTPEFSMSIEGEFDAVVNGDTGWMRVPEHGWVKTDPSSTDPVVMLATSSLELVRAAGDPRTLGAMMAQSDWTIVDQSPVPATDAVADVAWQLEPVSGSLQFGPVTTSDYQLWLTPGYLGAYAVGTGSFGSISVTTSNTFLQWGQPVEIPDPGGA